MTYTLDAAAAVAVAVEGGIVTAVAAVVVEDTSPHDPKA